MLSVELKIYSSTLKSYNPKLSSLLPKRKLAPLLAIRPMHLPLLPPISNFNCYVKGDVSIDESVAIAPGVILQADPDSKIIIAAGVCIGMGTIIHAHKGTLEVEAGAILGAGVLVIGKGKIGANACIGSVTTIWNTSVEPYQVVVAGSLLGDKGRQVADAEGLATGVITEANGHSAHTTEKEAVSPTLPSTTYKDPVSPTLPNTTYKDPSAQKEPESPQKEPESPPNAAVVPVYGQANLNRLMKTLFPHNKSLSPSPENSESE